MDIFEQLESAHILLVNDIPTTNFGWNADDEEEDWMLSVYGDDPEFRGLGYEYYLTKNDLRNAKEHGDAWEITDDDGNTVYLEFCMLIPVAEMKHFVEEAGGKWYGDS